MRKRKFVSWIGMTIATLFVLFIVSDTPYANQDIKPFLFGKVEFLDGILPDISFHYGAQYVSTTNIYSFIEFILRKLGHIAGYFLLTICLYATLTFTKLSEHRKIMLSFIIPICYAMLDEWHQTTVPGRTGRLIDVYTVDALGILLAIIIITVNRKMVRMG
ncbi:VanZ family protein [Aquibacillus rhizosphaerae]|uniref:VanZ family protein n=1 Tax=Aquibacillus rhizosphaerae TaxID=3051431 RepID=A0ABT7L025_9BACI|nr:VanZ family protein [Aquibacillus sp. LR5S19]MDL4839115.1 VanZ family protein [Aquibacillus sp. LR5S19]